MTTVLLADSDDTRAASLLEQLRHSRPHWQYVAFTHGKDVLEHAVHNEIACVVTEMTLADMTGGELLTQLKTSHRDIVRLAYSTSIEKEALLEGSYATHRFVNRALAVEQLIFAIEGSIKLQVLFNTDSLLKLIGDVNALPSLPQIYKDMMAELTSAQSSLQKVARIIESDTALTAAIVKTVNSSFYGLSQPVESVSQAVALLGAYLIKNITLTAKVFSQFDGDAREMQRLSAINNNGNRAGALCNHLARLASVSRSTVNHTQMAGLLGNVGELVILNRKKTAAKQVVSEQAEHTFSTELQGAYLLQTWQMPDTVVEAVALQFETPEPVRDQLSAAQILHSVRYLDGQLGNSADPTRLSECQTYIEQYVDKALAARWIDAYIDLQVLIPRQEFIVPCAA